jgi:hypothetical protein
MPGFRALFLQLNSCHGHFVFSVALGCSYPFLFMLFHLKSFVLVQYMACNNLIICHKGHQLLVQYMACNNLIIGPGSWVAQLVFVELSIWLAIIWLLVQLWGVEWRSWCLLSCFVWLVVVLLLLSSLIGSSLFNWQLSCLVLVCLKYIIMLTWKKTKILVHRIWNTIQLVNTG